MLKLLRYLKKYWYIAILAPVFMFGEVLMDMILSQYMEKMVDFGIQTNNIDNVIHYGIIMIIVVMVGVISGILSGVFTNIASFNFSNDLRKDLFKKIMNLSYHQTDHFSTGSLVTRVTNDITQVQNVISMSLRMLIRALSFFVLGIVLTLQISPAFGKVLLIALPLEVLIIFVFMKIIFPVFTLIQKKLDRVNTIVHENVSGARVVKAFTKEEYEFNRFVEANDDYTERNLYVGKLGALIMPLMMIIVFGSQIAIYYIGGHSIFNTVNGMIPASEMLMVGQISQAITYIFMIFMSIMMLGMMFMNMARAIASAKRINEVLDTEVEIIDGQLEGGDIMKKGTIEFKNVSFRYPHTVENVLKNISFKINRGETIAIVGSTGAGKTTLVNLITRFYDTSDGSVFVDGYDVKEYKINDLRNKISICLQTSELFSGTIFENISFGKPDASLEEIKWASEIAQASDFVLSKTNGYDEYVEEKGTSLSGGQKQRLSIARAIVRKPEILIFDDSTSALDLVTEAKLYQGLKTELKDTTKIAVVQRAATAKNADRIMVLDGGKIVAFDTHDTLLQNCTVYQDIYKSQLKREGVFHE